MEKQSAKRSDNDNNNDRQPNRVNASTEATGDGNQDDSAAAANTSPVEDANENFETTNCNCEQQQDNDVDNDEHGSTHDAEGNTEVDGTTSNSNNFPERISQGTNEESVVVEEEEVEEPWEDEIVERQVDLPPVRAPPHVSERHMEGDDHGGRREESFVSTPNGFETMRNQRTVTSIPPPHNNRGDSRRVVDVTALQRAASRPDHDMKGQPGPRERIFPSKNGNDSAPPRNQNTYYNNNNRNNTSKTREDSFRDDPFPADDVESHQDWQTYFWKRGGRNTTTRRNSNGNGDDDEEGQVVTAEDAPRPRHVDTVLRKGQANYANRRWIQFARPGAVQMDGRAPYSGGFTWRLMQAGARQQRQPRQPQEQQQQQQQSSGNEGSQPQEMDNELSPPHLMESASREEQAVGVPAFVVNDEGLDDTVIEGVHVQAEQGKDNANTIKFMGAFSSHVTWICILVTLLIGAAIVVPTLIVSDETQIVSSAETNETIPEQESFPPEFVMAVQHITSLNDLLLPGSPQNRAMKWMLSGANSTLFRSPQDPRFLQRYILGVFGYAAMVDENLRSSFHLLEKSVDECNWRGITCTSSSLVNGIHFAANLLEEDSVVGGTLPSELGGLPELRSLRTGPLGLQGTISPGLANASKLEAMTFRGNDLRAPFPDSFRYHPTLQYVSISENLRFGGTFPQEVLSTLPGLTHFGANRCGLTGKIPTEIGLLTSLKYLYLEKNNLTGTLPRQLGNLSNIEQLTVYSNQLTGPITEPIIRVWPEIMRLVLSNNLFTGEIPNSIPLVPSESPFDFREVYLHGNLFSGAIPSTLANLNPIRNLTLHDNNFVGVVPTRICEMARVDAVGNFGGLNLTADCSTSRVICTCCRKCY